MGKTSLATNIAYNAASMVKHTADDSGSDIEERETIAFFSLGDVSGSAGDPYHL